MKIKRFTVPFLLSKQVNEEGEFEGFASTFGNIDFGNDVVEKGAFKEDLLDWEMKGQLPLMAWQHDIFTLVGDFLTMREDEKGLFVKGKIWLGTKAIDASKMAHNLLTGTGPKGMSIGYSVLDSTDEVIDGERVRLLKKLKLWEVSIVPFGMNDQAVVTSAKSLLDDEGKIKDIRSFEKALRDGGLSTKEAKTLISGGYSALNRDDGMDELEAALDKFNKTHSI